MILVGVVVGVGLVAIVAMVTKNRDCPECHGRGGFECSVGWVPCWLCIRRGRAKFGKVD